MCLQLDAIFHSLADSTRRDILFRLTTRELSVSELTENYNISMPAVSKHLSVLENAELITRRRDGRKFMLRSNPAMLKNVDDWILFYREFWMDSLEKMTKYLTTLEGKEEYEKPSK